MRHRPEAHLLVHHETMLSPNHKGFFNFDLARNIPSHVFARIPVFILCNVVPYGVFRSPSEFFLIGSCFGSQNGGAHSSKNQANNSVYEKLKRILASARTKSCAHKIPRWWWGWYGMVWYGVVQARAMSRIRWPHRNA